MQNNLHFKQPMVQIISFSTKEIFSVITKVGLVSSLWDTKPNTIIWGFPKCWYHMDNGMKTFLHMVYMVWYIKLKDMEWTCNGINIYLMDFDINIYV
jgi:hypothetical protein